MKKWSKPFNNFLIIKKDIIKFWYWCYIYGIVVLFTKLYIDVQDIYVPFFIVYILLKGTQKNLYNDKSVFQWSIQIYSMCIQ